MNFNKKFLFKYHTIFVIITYLIVYLFESGLGINVFSNNIIIKLIGTLCGYFINDIFIRAYTQNYYFYFQNILKYFSILGFQNIVSKILIPNYIVFNFNNIFKINFVIFVYFLFDVILDVNIKDNNKNKEMYIDIIKASFGFYIIEKILKKTLNYEDYIYMIIIAISYYVFYSKMEKKIKFHLTRN
jgi:hypothetical protein